MQVSAEGQVWEGHFRQRDSRYAGWKVLGVLRKHGKAREAE